MVNRISATNLPAQLRYRALNDALRYAKEGRIKHMELSINFARVASYEMGMPLARAVEERIHQVYVEERSRRGDWAVVHYMNMADNSWVRFVGSVISKNEEGAVSAFKDHELYSSMAEKEFSKV